MIPRRSLLTTAAVERLHHLAQSLPVFRTEAVLEKRLHLTHAGGVVIRVLVAWVTIAGEAATVEAVARVVGGFDSAPHHTAGSACAVARGPGFPDVIKIHQCTGAQTSTPRSVARQQAIRSISAPLACIGKFRSERGFESSPIRSHQPKTVCSEPVSIAVSRAAGVHG
jgi:hypothetical protein